jgi:hypothetical protein
MREEERDKLLHKAEVMFMKRKVDCKTDEKKRIYGIAANAIHRDRAYHVKDMTGCDAGFGQCTCGKIVKMKEKPFYCSSCGQRLSTKYGWSVDDYYNEKNSDDNRSDAKAIIGQLNEMYSKMDDIQETDICQDNENAMHYCGEIMGHIDNLIDVIEK